MNAAPASTVAVILAAGGGSRYDGDTHKLLASLRGPVGEELPVVVHALRAAAAAAIGPIVVVTGAAPLDEAVELVRADHPTADIATVHHPGWRDGQATSLAAGVRAATDRNATAIVVGLGDQPGVTADAWRRVAAADSPIAVAAYDGRRGNPVRLAAEVWPLLPTDGDAGARVVMRLHPDLVGEVACHGSAFDIDTLEDLARWQNS
ncbi:MAG: nucleotidyltransferase family protein [Actinomycetota bacterium]